MSSFTVTNQGQGTTGGPVRIGLYLSTDSVITPADTLADSFTTTLALPPGGSETFPFEGELFVDIPKVAPGTYFVGYLADDVGQMFETNEANNYVSAASAQLTVVADLVITTTSPLPSGAVGVTYPSTQLTATGGVGAYHWVTAQSGPLPAGLELSDGGLITGTPKVGGTFPVEVHVSDSAANPHFAVKFLQLAVTSGVPFIGLSAGNQQSPAVASQRPGAVAPSASSRRRASWTSRSAPATSAERMRRNSE